MSSIFIMGAGGFGCALAIMASKYGNKVTLWSPFGQEIAALNEHREHKKLLPGIKIDSSVEITCSLDSLASTQLVIIATPTFAVRQTAQLLSQKLGSAVPVACVSKGLEPDTNKTLSTIIEEILPFNPVVALSGPSHAEEVARCVATTIVAASRSRQAAELVQDTLMNDSLRIYVNDDILGVELGGALKNVIALAAGILDGVGAGDNTKAALMTRGITEIARLGTALGAKGETFAGLSGIGDLIVTCSSMHSRNRRCGILIGQGVGVEQALQQIGMTVEGYPCTMAAYQLSLKTGIDMPIVTEAYRILYENKSVSDGIKDLMQRPKRHESEAIWLLSR